MSTADSAFSANSTEHVFQSITAISLKPLLQFVTTECLAAMPTSGPNLVDFVMQLLETNKERLYQMCRGNDSVSMQLQSCHNVLHTITSSQRSQSPKDNSRIQELGAPVGPMQSSESSFSVHLDSEVRLGSFPEVVSFSVPHVPFQYPTDFNFSEESNTIRAPSLPPLDHSRLSAQQAALAEQVQKQYLEAEAWASDLLRIHHNHLIHIMRNSWMQWHRLPLLLDDSKTSSFPQLESSQIVSPPSAVQEQSPSVVTRSPAGYGTQSSSALARDPALFHKLAEASISSLKRKDKRFMGEVFSRHAKPLGLSAKALASALHAIDHSTFPAQVSDADAECKLKEVDISNKGYANFEEFCQAAKISRDAGADTDTSAARDVFLRFVKGLSAQELVAALEEVDAPVLLSSEGSSPEQIFRRADVNMSGSVDFAELDPPSCSRHFSLTCSSLWFQVHACS